jgi:threonine dehydratase
VQGSLPGTPQYAWPLLAERSGAEVWVKHENHTPTGAFKLRGGLIYVERLRREHPQVRGIVSATHGNHGQLLAWAGRRYRVASRHPRGWYRLDSGGRQRDGPGR